MTQLEKISEKLLENEEVLFSFNGYYIYIQERVEGGYEGDIYASEEAFDNGEEPIDGGVCEAILPFIAIEFFKEVANDLKRKQ